MRLPALLKTSRQVRAFVRWRNFSAAAAVGLALSVSPGRSESSVEVDTALILAVDVSDSVDETRYNLQMEGIARALEDQSVVNAITGGPQGGIVLSLVTWADQAPMTLTWQVIKSAEDGRRVAALVRAIPHQGGEYTCLAKMLKIAGEQYLESIPGSASHTVIDVSGDGIDNCADPDAVLAARDALIGRGVTINGLPIIVKGENDIVGSGAYRAPGYGLKELPEGAAAAPTTLDAWYRNFVIGGPTAFLHVSNGFEDFGRAFRQKFVTEISAVERAPSGH